MFYLILEENKKDFWEKVQINRSFCERTDGKYGIEIRLENE